MGLMVLLVVGQFMGFKGRGVQREQRVQVVLGSGGEMSAQERAQGQYQRALESGDQAQTEKQRLVERNRDVPPPFRHLSDFELEQKRWEKQQEGMVGPESWVRREKPSQQIQAMLEGMKVASTPVSQLIYD